MNQDFYNSAEWLSFTQMCFQQEPEVGNLMLKVTKQMIVSYDEYLKQDL